MLWQSNGDDTVIILRTPFRAEVVGPQTIMPFPLETDPYFI